MEISEPVTIIFNTSIKQVQVPMQWKEAHVVLVPKPSPVMGILTDLRPIPLTAITSQLDPKQFERFFHSRRIN